MAIRRCNTVRDCGGYGQAEIGNGNGEVGEVVSDKLEVACGNNQTIKILEIQRQGKNPQKISEFMLGSRIKKGLLIPNV